MKSNAEVGLSIRQLRLSRNETRKDLADAVGVEEKTIGKYELGFKRPKDSVKWLIAKHFRVDVGPLFYGGINNE